MKELIDRLKTLKINIIFYEQTDNFFVQLFRYVFVGGIAFIADWGMMVFLHETVHMNVYVATAIAFTFGFHRSNYVDIIESWNCIYDCKGSGSSISFDMEFCSKKNAII